MDKAQEKVCVKCGESKPLTAAYFHRNVVDKSGFYSYCKPCAAEAQKKYRAKPRARTLNREYHAALRQFNRMLLLEHYSNGSMVCACCGEAHLEFLGLDHIEGGGHQDRKEKGSYFYSWLIKNNYPPGLRVLCHNCNQSRGLYGYCPHERE